MTRTALNEKEWPVHVFRKTEQAWQKMQPKNSHGRTVAIKATPRRNSIVLHRIQVRIRLTDSSATGGTKDSDGSPPPAAATAADDSSSTSVVRRRDCLLISSKKRLRTLLLKFRDEAACLEFSDLFVTLNPPPERAVLAGTNDESTADGAVLLRRGGGTTTTLHHPDDSQQVLSYVGRLLHDEDFASMCDNLEACISASEDGARMLRSLVNGGGGGDVENIAPPSFE